LCQHGDRPQQAQKYDELPAHEKEGEGPSSCESAESTSDRDPATRPGSQDRRGARKTKPSLSSAKRFFRTQPSTGLASLQRLIGTIDGEVQLKVAKKMKLVVL